jgi:Fungal Zn(2)-Cys(6) binuclear cluster domain
MDEHFNSLHAPNEDDENGHNASAESQYHTHDEGAGADTQDESLEDNLHPLGQPRLDKNSIPMQKRRRVTRACDECRRKKIKCDGKQPCTHCTVYSYGKK